MLIWLDSIQLSGRGLIIKWTEDETETETETQAEFISATRQY